MAYAATLLVSQDQALIDTVQAAINEVGELRLETTPALEGAVSQLCDPDLTLLLLHLPAQADSDSLAELVRAALALGRPVATVVLSDRHRAADTLRFLRLGAADCLDRPLDVNRLVYLIDVLTVRARYAASRISQEQPGIVRLGDGDPFLYVSTKASEGWVERVKRVAPRDATVLLTGETGTGKTRLARLIHELSGRRDQPFITVHCGALSASLMESELFGHVKGAFTGAVRDRAGKFTEVGRGTLLLDDIDALPLDLQAKLLRVVEEHVFEPVGSNRLLKMAARLIVASNRCLEQEVAGGRLRLDLYYRLNVVGFHSPPLRERPEVIPPLIDHFVRHFGERSALTLRGVAPAAVRVMQQYAWPGNIRELRNVIERAVALCATNEIQLVDLPEAIQSGVARESDVIVDVQRQTLAEGLGTLAKTREEAEAQHIAEALERHKNNRKHVAAELGISRMTLYKKLHRYGLMGATG
jgi:DNA-binding NtrC family response regulator